VPELRRATLALAVAALAGCGGGTTHSSGGPAGGLPSSWVPGQAPLSSSAAFIEISVRADDLAARRSAARHQELVLLAADRLAAKRQARDDALRRYEEARRAAQAKYRAALRRAAREKARQLARLRKARAERAALLKRLRDARKVTPGEECEVAAVRAQFDCMSGHIPAGR